MGKVDADFICLGIALADDQLRAVQNVFAIAAVLFVQISGNLRELELLIRHRDALEDPVITASEAAALIVREVGVLRDLSIVESKISGDAVDDLFNIHR